MHEFRNRILPSRTWKLEEAFRARKRPGDYFQGREPGRKTIRCNADCQRFTKHAGGDAGQHPRSIYWAMVTMTTVKYGGISPGTQTCSRCFATGHDDDAWFCKYCGEASDRPSLENA